MFEKIKHCLSKAFQGRKILLILILIFIGLFAAVEPAQAFVFDLAKSAMAGLADLGGWAFALFFTVFFALGLSHAFASISASLLDWAMGLPINVIGNPLIDGGWNFIAGLANLFFILIFIAIAFAYILKTETFGMKKALPRLIIVALLVNFSLILVGGLVDIAGFFQNTILAAVPGDLSASSVERLVSTTNELAGSLRLRIGLLAGGLAIPYVDVVKTVVNIFIALFFLPTLVQALFLIFFNIIMGLIFFLYFALFVSRIVIIWILAIAAPLAFTAFILPQTKKYWDSWFKYLLQWTMLGIVALFLLVIGLNLMIAALPPAEKMPATIIGIGFEFREYMIYYLFLIVYLLIAFHIAKKSVPAGADAIMNYGKLALGPASMAGKWLGSRALAKTREAIPESWRTEMKKMAIAKTPEWEKDKKGLSRWMFRGAAKLTGRAQRIIGGAAERVVVGGEEAMVSEIFEKSRKNNMTQNLKALRQAKYEAERMGIIKAMIDKKQIKNALNADIVGKENVLTGKEILASYKKARQLRDKDSIDSMEATFVMDKYEKEDGTKTPMWQKFAEVVDRETKDYGAEEDRTGVAGRPSGLDKEDVEERRHENYADKIMAGMGSEDIKQMRRGWYNDKELMNAVHKFWGGHQIGEAARTFGRSFVSLFEKQAHERGADWYLDPDPKTGKIRNAAAPRFLASSAAQALGINPLEGAETPEQINKKLNVASILAKHRPTEKDPSLLEAPYIRLKALVEAKERLSAEIKRGAPQDKVDEFQKVIEESEKEMRNAIDIAAGKSSNRDQLEKDWDRIEQIMTRKN